MKEHYLFLTNTATIGGAERKLIDCFNFINYEKYKVTWGVRENVFSSCLKNKGLPVSVLALPGVNKTDSFIKKFINFYRFFKLNNPDCIVFSQFSLKSFSLPEVIAAYIITKGNVYMIVHDFPPLVEKYKSKLHFGIFPGLGLAWRRGRIYQRLLVVFVKRVLAVSEYIKESLIKLHGYPERKIKLAHHGVDIYVFSPSLENRMKLRKQLNITESDTVIVSTSRLARIKKIDRLIEAFASLAQQRQDIQLILVGSGDKYDELLTKVNSLKSSIIKRIKFVGFQNNVENYLQASDIYVLSSDSEGFCISCLEALSCGVITLVTDCGGPRDFVSNGWSGFIVEKTADNIKKGLEEILNLNKDDKKYISHNAREFIVKNFQLYEKVKPILNLLGMNSCNKRINE